MKNTLNYIVVLFFAMLVTSCGNDASKPVAKPEALLGVWQWPCYDDADTSGTASPLSERAKRVYGEKNAYTLEIVTYRGSDCAEEKAVSKSIYKGTYTAVEILDSDQVPYMDIDYAINSRTFEGSRLIAATTVSGLLHKDNFKCHGIARVFPSAGQLHVEWMLPHIEIINGIEESNVTLCPNDFEDYLDLSSITTSVYVPVTDYNTSTLAQLVGQWTEGCGHEGTDPDTGIDYYSETTYKIDTPTSPAGPAKYTQIEGLYLDNSCGGTPVSSYTYPGEMVINTLIGDNGSGKGPSDIPGVIGLNVKITFAATISSISDTGSITLTEHSHTFPVYDIMVSNEASEYLFVNGRTLPTQTDIIRDIYVRVLPVTTLP